MKNIVQFFNTHPKAGIVGGKILNADGAVQSSVRRFPKLLDQALILLGLHKVAAGFSLRPAQPKGCGYQYPFSSLNRYFATDFDYAHEAEVDQVMGAFMAVRREVFFGGLARPSFVTQNLSGFDEKFFLWFEEVDLCKRAHALGWKVYYTPTAVVTHEGAASFKQVSVFRRRAIWLQSLWHFFQKHGW